MPGGVMAHHPAALALPVTSDPSKAESQMMQLAAAQ